MASSPEQEREFAFDKRDFRFLADLAYARTGIVLADHKQDMVYGRLARRLRALKLASFSEYCDLLQSDAGTDEMSQLINALTTNLTSFFREPHHFEHLRNEVLLPIVKSGKRPKLRVWSAAASSGMEPYSLAMTMREAIRDIDAWDAKILATDIDSNMLNKGRAGEYAASDVEDIPAMYKKYIEDGKTADRVQMSPDLRKLLTFNQLNLLERWPMKGQFDAVFCRNVVIYFDKPTKVKLFMRMAEVIKPDGWLYIGHSENLHGISDRFRLVGRTIYQRVK